MKLLLAGLLMGALCSGAWAQQPMGSESARMAAAEKLFYTPAYRKLIIRTLYETFETLPPDKNKAAVEALNDPSVANAMRRVLLWSMAGTYSVGELEFLQRTFAAPEMDTFMARENAFRDTLMREFTAAVLSDPALLRYVPIFTSE